MEYPGNRPPPVRAGSPRPRRRDERRSVPPSRTPAFLSAPSVPQRHDGDGGLRLGRASGACRRRPGPGGCRGWPFGRRPGPRPAARPPAARRPGAQPPEGKRRRAAGRPAAQPTVRWAPARRRGHPLSLRQRLQLTAELANGLDDSISRDSRSEIREVSRTIQTNSTASASPTSSMALALPRSPERFCPELKDCGGDVTAGETKRGPLFKGPQGRLGCSRSISQIRQTLRECLPPSGNSCEVGRAAAAAAGKTQVSDLRPSVVVNSDVRGVPCPFLVSDTSSWL